MTIASSRTCPGTEVRFITWNDLTLTFGDESNVSSGRQHFYAWSLGPPAGAVVPFGMHTPEGIGIASTVAEIKVAYPAVALFEGDELALASAHISEALFAFLTETADNGSIVAMLGGQGCGE